MWNDKIELISIWLISHIFMVSVVKKYNLLWGSFQKHIALFFNHVVIYLCYLPVLLFTCIDIYSCCYLPMLLFTCVVIYLCCYLPVLLCTCVVIYLCCYLPMFLFICVIYLCYYLPVLLFTCTVICLCFYLLVSLFTCVTMLYKSDLSGLRPLFLPTLPPPFSLFL